MRNIMIAMMSLLLASCGQNQFRARLNDGSLVTVTDRDDTQAQLGDSVQLTKTTGNVWYIDNDEIKPDTAYVVWTDTTYGPFVVFKRSGVLVKAL